MRASPLHEEFADASGIDLNRAGTPLLEIVSEPDLRNAKEAVAYLKKLHSIVRYLDISDGDMSQGSMRCDANVSIRRPGAELGTRTEIKNVNSFRFVEKAINFEIRRQRDVLEDGGTITQETRHYDSVRDETRPMRGKEVANDYRYFPEPDLLPVEIGEDLIERIRSELPELPDARKRRFADEYDLSAYDAGVLTASREMADYFERVARGCGGRQVGRELGFRGIAGAAEPGESRHRRLAGKRRQLGRADPAHRGQNDFRQNRENRV